MRPNTHASGVKAEAGEAFTDGMDVVMLKGKHNATITSVELVGDREIKLVGFKLATPERIALGGMGSIQHMPWPPKDRDLPPESVVPGVGTTITPLVVTKDGPTGSYELLLGHKVEEEGYFVRRGFWINYTADGEEYRQYYPAVMSICAGDAHAKRKFCPLPKNWEDMDAPVEGIEPVDS